MLNIHVPPVKSIQFGAVYRVDPDHDSRETEEKVGEYYPFHSPDNGDFFVATDSNNDFKTARKAVKTLEKHDFDSIPPGIDIDNPPSTLCFTPRFRKLSEAVNSLRTLINQAQPLP